MENKWKILFISQVVSYYYYFTGDHIRIHQTGYQHHMLVIKVIDPYRNQVRVIHYASAGAVMAGKLGKGNQILEVDKIITEPIERAVYKDDVSMWDAQEGVRRARSRKDETDYKLFSNNCESFVNWALTSVDVTDQGKTAPLKVAVGAAIGIGAVAAGVGALIGMLTSNDSDKDDEEKE